MPFSEFVKSFKAACMLENRNAMLACQISGYPHMAEGDRKKFWRDLKNGSEQFMKARIKDYREVLGGIVKRLKQNG